MHKISGLLFLTALCFCTLTAFSQQRYTIKGRVINEDRLPVEYGNVGLLKNDSILVSHTTTDSLGNFIIDVEQGDYKILITQFGNEFLRKDVFVDQDLNIGELAINEIKVLDEVTVTGRKRLIERRIDRLVFNIENATSMTGADALDALKITPRVKVQNDQISMIGKSTMSVMIDDRILQLTGDDLTNYLKTIKSDDIKSIEVITNPPSKYDAEGNSGIINIITKKAKSNMWNSSLRAIYKQASHATGSGSASFNMKRNKLSLTSSASYIKGTVAPVETSKIYYQDVTWEEVNNRKDNSNAISLNLGLDYELSKNVSTGITYRHVTSKPAILDNNSSYVFNSESNILDSMFLTDGRNDKEVISNQFNYHLIYRIDSSGRKLSLDYDFFRYKSNSERPFNTKRKIGEEINPFLSALNIGNQDIRNNSVNVDMEHPTNWVTMNYGGRISLIETTNDFSYYNLKNNMPELDPLNSNSFTYSENTQALYFSGHKQISEKWEAKLGLRMESTQTKGISPSLNETNRINYTEFFPTAYIVYNPNADNSFSINYGKRIQRPSYSFLNPFRWVTSPYMYSEGNPFVQPSFANNFEFGYNFKDNLVTSLYFSRVNDGFGQVTFLDEEINIQRILVRNYLLNKTFGISQMVAINPMSWFRANFFADIYYNSSKSKIPEALQSLEGWNGEFTLNTDITLNKSKTALLNVNYLYVTAGKDELYHNSNFDQLDISIKYLMFDNKLSVAMHANDIFSSNRPTYTTFNNSIKNSFRNYYDERYVRLSIIYNFGKVFKKDARKAANSEEYDRLR